MDNKIPTANPADKSKRANILAMIGFVIFVAFYFVSYFHRIAIPGTIFNQLQRDFAITATEVSMLGAGFLYVYAAMQLFAGIFVDKWGTAKVIFCGALAMTAGSFGFARADDYTALLIFRIITALGASLIYLSLVREIADVFSEKNFTVFLSFALVTGYCGGLAGTYPFERASNAWGWRNSITGLAVFTLAVLIIFSTMLIKRRNAARETVKISTGEILKITGNIFTFPIYVTNCIAFSVYFLIQSSIGKKMLEDCFGFHSDTAAVYTLALVAATIIGSGFSGVLSRAINNRRKPFLIAGACFALSFSVMMMAAVYGAAGKWIIMPAYIMLGLSSVGVPVGIANARELNFPKFTGTAVGFLNAGCYAGVAVLITAAGSMLDLFSDYAVKNGDIIAYPKNAYIAVLTMCMVLSVFSVFGSFIVKETCGVNISLFENKQ